MKFHVRFGEGTFRFGSLQSEGVIFFEEGRKGSPELIIRKFCRDPFLHLQPEYPHLEPQTPSPKPKAINPEPYLESLATPK